MQTSRVPVIGSGKVFVSKFPNNCCLGLAFEIFEEFRWKFSREPIPRGTFGWRKRVWKREPQGDRRTVFDRLSVPLLRRSSRVKRSQTGTGFLEVEIEEKWSPLVFQTAELESIGQFQSTLRLEFPSL